MNHVDPIDYELHEIIAQKKEYDRQRSEAAQMLEATAEDSMLANLKKIETILKGRWIDGEYFDDESEE